MILFVLAVAMVLGQPSGGGGNLSAGKDPMQLAQFPLAVPYLLNPVGIVGLVTISAEANSVSVFAVAIAILAVVLLIDVAVFRWANRVSAKLDESRMLVTEKVFGFLIAAIGVQLVLDGLASVGVITPIYINHTGRYRPPRPSPRGLHPPRSPSPAIPGRDWPPRDQAGRAVFKK